MRLSIIAAVSANQVIGRNNTIPWRLPADLKRFKSLTMGHHLLMGRKTFESIGRPLPGRTTVVITHRNDYAPKGVLVAHSLNEAVKMASGDDEVFIAGGAQIYRQTLARATRLYLTLIHEEFEGDTYFPEINESDWLLSSKDAREPDEENPYRYSFLVYDKKS
ncbi:dihydrofolate reductase [Acidobacteria bacterium AH-259-A15]|nr:dihydrofolate reductase [Acidobacteria bacterium AH-259-A15]